ncbi:transcription termination factor Rho [Nocardioides humilatus]|uniref:Transcription termination factor Rho n=1 Tax=Nocardioides humilatus TaxID=2607660 RepID=A0A5B1LQW5_9ACTN|nr:transcription termination factor Rho [Nocardioides humilatus]KAA1421997.1 transcription termination factor Rho [Nocardioides humilatus]
MLLADLKAMAGGMGIAGAGTMKKADLVDAIKAAQARPKAEDKALDKAEKPKAEERAEKPKAEEKAEKPKADKPATDESKADKPETGEPKAQKNQGQQKQSGQGQGQQKQGQGQGKQQDPQGKQQDPQGKQQDTQDKQDGQQQGQQGQAGEDDGEGGARRNRRRRGRDRNRPLAAAGGPGGGGGGGRNEPDTTILEDDVLVPAAGILDVLDNYAFVRTSGYLAGPDDVYLSLSMVRKYGLRRGDAIVGQVRQPREGERREKFNPMVRIDNVNGVDPEQARHRVDFAKLTPLYPSERLRLETEPGNMIGRVIDIASPIGKGQRGLIVSPAKAGKTMILQSIANSITTNNPECHLMVVLVDERPEEVTDFERSVKGEVISSTFDRPATDHTTVAELAIERAKRLVELGHDVVVLLDGITRLGRAYNLAAPASGRILSGGVDSAALYPPKKFFGAARNIENGGSLTILATALIDSGSKMDEVIFEEFKGTGNMEIRLRRDFADKRIFPAIDVIQSGTRREELLLSKEEMAIIWKLRRVLSALDSQQALEVLLEKLKKSSTNIDFLMQVQKTTPSPEVGE